MKADGERQRETPIVESAFRAPPSVCSTELVRRPSAVEGSRSRIARSTFYKPLESARLGPTVFVLGSDITPAKPRLIGPGRLGVVIGRSLVRRRLFWVARSETARMAGHRHCTLFLSKLARPALLPGGHRLAMRICPSWPKSCSHP
jgi:hypothetical protein